MAAKKTRDGSSDLEAKILRELDRAVKEKRWPTMVETLGSFEYHAMRLVAARSAKGDDWGVVLEVVCGDYLGDDPDDVERAGVEPFCIGSNVDELPGRAPLKLKVRGERDERSTSIEGVEVTGPAGALRCKDSMRSELDLEPGMLCGEYGSAQDLNFVLLLRAYLAKHPGSLFGDPKKSIQPLRLGKDAKIIVVSEAFHHVFGASFPRKADASARKDPSASPTYRSLAVALAASDGSRFEPGTSNLDFRKWATHRDPLATEGRPAAAPGAKASGLQRTILDALDKAANERFWPEFYPGASAEEYYALRVIGVRGGGTDWGVVLQSIAGSLLAKPKDNAPDFTLRVQSVHLGSQLKKTLVRHEPLRLGLPKKRDVRSLSIEGIDVEGPAGTLHCTDAMLKSLDLRPGKVSASSWVDDSNLVLLVRAYCAKHPGALWPDARRSIEPLGLGPSAEIVVITDAFEHVMGAKHKAADKPLRRNPSDAVSYRSLALAIETGDAKNFDPGTPNTDWRRWATEVDKDAKRPK